MIECPECGAENRGQARFCVVCGRNMKFGDSPSIPSTLHTLHKGFLLSGRFKVDELINVGGMGYIYRGNDVKYGSPVAIKELIDRFTSIRERTDAIERFEREAKILCGLNHPAVPHFFEHFVENHRYYLVMDYIEGLDLRRILRRLTEAGKKIPVERVLRWTLEICDVLDYLHFRNPPIIYRDLKPSNIMITGEGKVKLVDFGIARLFISQEKATMVGTQGYAPPEQYRGESEPRSDIYSLGATLHHLLTGKDPQYEAPFHFEPLRKLNPELPATLEIIVEKALHLNPSDRYQSARELRAAIATMIVREDRFSDLQHEIRSIEDEISSLKHKKTKVLEVQVKSNGVATTEEEPSSASLQLDNPVWNHFRGNAQRSGLSPVTAHTQGSVLWQFTTGGKITAPPVADSEGNVFFGNHDNFIFALSPTGEQIWQYETSGPVASAGAAEINGKIYIPSEDGCLYAFDSKGAEKWRYKIKSSFKHSPLLGEKKVYISDSTGNLHCIDNRGNLLWKNKFESGITTSASMCYDGTLLFGTKNGEIIAIHPTGEIRWSIRLPKPIRTTPAISKEGYIITGCDDGFVYALNLFGKPVWKYKTEGVISSSPAVGKDGTVYIAATDRHLYAINRNGQEKWRFSTDDVMLSSPMASDEGTIYAASRDGILYALNPWGKARWWFNLRSEIISSPAMSTSGKIYIGTADGSLYAFC
ncbi:MAG: PQQ-binding-like beta-propeller repeat protein [Firmicutes bacterium]|nr:PQQ-binding-like beta-propeller repeat protein [Bacillota bacterium]